MAEQIVAQVPPELDGERLDKALAVMLGISRSRSMELIERGVTVDGVAARARQRVGAGATVVSPKPEAEHPLTAEPVDFGVLFEDEQVIVVDKPAGLVVHPGSGRVSGTLASGLLHRHPEIEGVGQPGRWGLVHRLDRDTSGALVVARTAAAYEALGAQLRERSLTRVYTALVEGVPGSPTGTIEAPIGRDPQIPTKRAVTARGKPATTHYEVDRRFDEAGCSLLTLTLDTGRTHQIRVHLAAIGHPVVGDTVYGRPSSAVGAPRTFLHSRLVGFAHPADGRRVVVESPLHDDLAGVLDSLEGSSRG